MNIEDMSITELEDYINKRKKTVSASKTFNFDKLLKPYMEELAVILDVDIPAKIKKPFIIYSNDKVEFEYTIDECEYSFQYVQTLQKDIQIKYKNLIQRLKTFCKDMTINFDDAKRYVLDNYNIPYTKNK